MGDLTTGYTWVTGEQVTHAKLNQAINDALINAAFVTGKGTPGGISAANDILLIFNNADNALRSVSLNSAFFNHSALLTDRTPIEIPVKEDSLFLKDADGGTPGYGRATLQKAVFENAELIANRTGNDTPAAGDEVLVKDSGAATFKRVTRANFLGYQWPTYLPFNNAGLLAHTAPIAADHLLVWDSVALANKKLTLDKLVGGLPDGAALADAQLIPVHDATSTLGKVTLATLKAYVTPAVAVTKFTYTAAAAIGAGDQQDEQAHGLGAVPTLMNWVVVCISTDRGYAVDDEISIGDLQADSGGGVPISTYKNATKVGALVDGAYAMMAASYGAAPATLSLDKTKWKLRCYAALIA